MTDKPTPTDAELKAMWQLHAADIGGIFYYARAVLAKWGTPAPVGVEPVAWAATSEDGVVEALGMNQSRRFDTPLYLAPQPVAREPLTDEQADAIALESFERHCGRPHPWEGAQPWVIAAIKAAHGIKGKEAGNAE